MLDTQAGKEIDTPEDPGEQTVRQDLGQLRLLRSVSKTDLMQSSLPGNAAGAVQGLGIQPQSPNLDDDDDDRPTKVFRIADVRQPSQDFADIDIQAKTIGSVASLFEGDTIFSMSDHIQLQAVEILSARQVAGSSVFNRPPVSEKKDVVTQSSIEKVLNTCAFIRGRYECGNMIFDQAQAGISVLIKRLQTSLNLQSDHYAVKMACAFLQDVQRVENYKCVQIRQAIQSYYAMNPDNSQNSQIFHMKNLSAFSSIKKMINPLLTLFHLSLPELKARLEKNPDFTTDNILSDTVLDFLRLQKKIKPVLSTDSSSSKKPLDPKVRMAFYQQHLASTKPLEQVSPNASGNASRFSIRQIFSRLGKRYFFKNKNP